MPATVIKGRRFDPYAAHKECLHTDAGRKQLTCEGEAEGARSVAFVEAV